MKSRIKEFEKYPSHYKDKQSKISYYGYFNIYIYNVRCEDT